VYKGIQGVQDTGGLQHTAVDKMLIFTREYRVYYSIQGIQGIQDVLEYTGCTSRTKMSDVTLTELWPEF